MFVSASASDRAGVSWQASLFAGDHPGVDVAFGGSERRWLGDGAWIERVPGWVRGADTVFAELATMLAWQQRTVTMYDRRLPEPRLTAWWSAERDGDEPLPVLSDARAALSGRFGRAFSSIGFNLYRDGQDSVAWHGDRLAGDRSDAVVAVVSLGAARPFLLRPAVGGSSITVTVGPGDLLVMGGTCQATWQHCVPKVARVSGARISVTFRHGARLPE